VKRLPSFREEDALLAALVLGLWPVWRWLFLRATDGSDQPFGLLALVALVYFGLRRQEGRADWRVAGVFAFLYALSVPSAPFLLWGGLGLLAFSFALSARAGTRFQAGLVGLSLLSLPILASLQFYLGYPLRVVVAHLSRLFLSITGREILVSGTALEWGPHVVSVDAPCSGVQMLWACLFLVCFLAARDYWSTGKTLLIATYSVALVLLANALRAASLFLVSTAPVELPSGLHDALGVGAFALVALGVVWVASRFGTVDQVQASTVSRDQWKFLGLCLLAGAAGFVSAEQSVTASGPFPGWPKQFEGRRLEQRPLSEDEIRFAKGFPGRVGRFYDGRREIIIRWVLVPTRRLHPASDCLKGVGYRIEPGPLVGDRLWSSFRAERNEKVLQVTEQIVDADGRTFPDPSAWYWAALLGQSRGPWWSYSVAERSDSAVP
jgi:exosortase/archaeosortase family protein